MSWRAETEMQIQIMTHGEDFCPTTTNEVRMMLMNSIRNEMQKLLTEENEIKKGQEKVEEELGNETKESTFSSPWKFCRNLLNEERGQMNENKIKEGQEEEQEDQGNKLVMYRRRAYINSAVLSSLSHVSSELMEARYDNSRKQAYVEMEIRRLEIERFWKHALEKYMNIMRILESGSLTIIKKYFIKSSIFDFTSHVSSELMDIRYDNSETSKRIHLQVFQLQCMMSWTLSNFHPLTFPTWTNWKEYQESMMNILPFEEKMKVRRFLFRRGQSRRKLFFQKGQNKRVQWESEKERKYLEIWERNAITQHAAPQQSGKLIDIIEDYGGFDVTEKGEGKRAIFADCHLESRPGQAFNPFELHAECRPKCPFVVNVKKRNAGQTNDVASQTFPVCKPGEDIFKRNAITQHAAPQQSGKLIDIIEDHGGFDVTEKGGNAITQHAAPQQSGKLIDITEDQCEFDDTEKEIQEMDELLRCKVCLDSDACIVFLPCRHMATCEYCEGFLNHCPVCRSFIEEAVKINEE